MCVCLWHGYETDGTIDLVVYVYVCRCFHTLVDEMIVALLDSGQREVVYCACGVLVNLMADPAHRDVLAANAGIRK